jgi:hypothetical protein
MERTLLRTATRSRPPILWHPSVAVGDEFIEAEVMRSFLSEPRDQVVQSHPSLHLLFATGEARQRHVPTLGPFIGSTNLGA